MPPGPPSAAGAVEAKHQEAAQPLPEGVSVDGLLQIGDQFRASPEGEFCLEAIFDGLDPQFLERGDGPLGERFVSEVS